MKRLIILFLFVARITGLFAQTQQELMQAYRNGALPKELMDTFQEVQGYSKNVALQDSAQKIRRTRNVNISREKAGGGSATAVRGHVAPVLVGGSDVKGELGSMVMKRIYGHDLFQGENLTFEPNLNIATPQNYTLGPGDELIIDIWGDAQMTIDEVISPDGKINVSGIGLVSLSGLTIEEATRSLQRQLASIYEGLHNGTVKMKLSLGAIRSIQVNIMGEVGVAGTYTLPSLATLFHALHAAGGVSNLGTMRSIQLYRDGKLFSEVDVYSYIINGKSESDIALCEGDMIIVSAYDKLVEISGQVKRPMFYEMRHGETIADLIAFAGGFTNEANRNVINITRRQGGKFSSFTINAADYGEFLLADGDMLSVAGSIDRYENRVQIKGAVYREGYYAIDDKVKTVKQLIERADGLREDAFLARAVLYREKPDWTLEVEAVDLASLMSGAIADITLRANDMLVIQSVSQMQEVYNVAIFGEVQNPGTYPYAEGMTVEDLVVAANGLRESAATANVTITRRKKDSKSLQVSDQLFEVFTIELQDGLTVGQNKGFELKPFDEVYVRRSPVYVTQSSVTIKGEVAFEGNYPLSNRNMRLSEVVKTAGGFTSGAYLEGAYLLRKMTEEELMQKQALQQMIDSQARRARQEDEGVMELDGIQLQDVYSVGIRLDKAVESPNSDYDVELRDGDVVYIPKYNGTARVMGAVLYPNTITFADGRNVKYYVEAAGGFDNSARRRRVFVIHMNGMVEAGLNAHVRPGSIIVVPTKTNRGRFNWGDVVQGVSSTASMAAVVISAISLTK